MSVSAPTIAVVGAGPGLGRSIARRFGRAGHPVALIARTPSTLDAIATSLRAEGIRADTFPGDVTDEDGLTAALHSAAQALGRIGILSYSPNATWTYPPGRLPDLAALGYTGAAETTASSARAQFEVGVAGALTARTRYSPPCGPPGTGPCCSPPGCRRSCRWR